MKNKLLTICLIIALTISAQAIDLLPSKKTTYNTKIPKDCYNIVSYRPDEILCRTKNNEYFLVYMDTWLYRQNFVRAEE